MGMFKKKSQGSSLVEYALPAALIALVVGVTIYSAMQNDGFKMFVLKTVFGRLDESRQKIFMGSDTTLTPGLYKFADGKYYLATKSGKTIKIPEEYYDALKNSMDEFSAAQSDAVGEETTGAYGEEADNSSDTDYLTAQYSTMLEKMAESVEDEKAQRLLNNMAAYADKLSGLQTDLKDVKKANQ